MSRPRSTRTERGERPLSTPFTLSEGNFGAMTANDRKRPILPGTGGGAPRRWWRGTGGVALRLKDRNHPPCPPTILPVITPPRGGGTTTPPPKPVTPKFIPSPRHTPTVTALPL